MSGASSVVLASAFTTSKVSFSQPKVLDSGGKQAWLNYDGSKLFLQTPQCVLPYGMSVFDKAGPIKYSVELSLRGYDEAGSKIKQFYDAINALDEYMIDQGVKNSKLWFKSDLPRDVIKAFYSPMVRFSVDKEGNRKPYPPTFKLQLRQRNGDFEVKMWDAQRNRYQGVPMEELLVKGAQVTSIIQCTGVWFAGSKFGLTWKAEEMRVDVLPQAARGFSFVDDEPSPAKRSAPAPAAPIADEDEDDNDEDDVFKAPAPEPARPKPSVVAAVSAAHEEEEEPEDAEPVVVPKKPAVVTKKKVIAKK